MTASREMSLPHRQADIRHVHKSEKQNLSLECQQQRPHFHQLCMVLELCSSLPSKNIFRFSPVLPSHSLLSFSMCSTGHTHRSGTVCHRTQMPSCGRYSFSSIRLLLGKTFRQSKENSPGAALGRPCG